jgi:(p)ppGpp synthase/HD superfamily hydrolase
VKDSLRPEKKEKKEFVPQSASSNVIVEIEEGVSMPYKFAKCCKANEGERSDIEGVINRTGKVMVHRNKCRMLKSANPERKMEVKWEAF